jgi:hypothetical protein
LVTNAITFAFGVLSAIDFNDQTPFPADEIRDVGPNRLLPDEFHSIKRTRTESIPKPLFRDRGISAQPRRFTYLCNFCATHEAAPLTRNWCQCGDGQ